MSLFDDIQIYILFAKMYFNSHFFAKMEAKFEKHFQVSINKRVSINNWMKYMIIIFCH